MWINEEVVHLVPTPGVGKLLKPHLHVAPQQVIWAEVQIFLHNQLISDSDIQEWIS